MGFLVYVMIGPTGLKSNCYLRVVCSMLLCTLESQ